MVAVARGTGGGRSLLLNAHMDTVALGGRRAAAGRARRGRPDVRPRRLRHEGRAGGDHVGGRRGRAVSPAGDVIVSAVCDEEFASIGAQALVRALDGGRGDRHRADGEEVCLAVAHKGFSWHEIEVRGVAAHGSRPQDGVDAIARMGRVLVGIDALAADLAARPPHPLLGNGSVHASLIEGGRELSTYPDRCLLQLERRTLPGETREVVEAELAAILDAIVADDPTFEAGTRTTLVRPWLETSPDAEIVQAMDAALGGGAEVIGVPYWADSAIIADSGIPTVICGPGGAGAHAGRRVGRSGAARPRGPCADRRLRLVLRLAARWPRPRPGATRHRCVPGTVPGSVPGAVPGTHRWVGATRRRTRAQTHGMGEGSGFSPSRTNRSSSATDENCARKRSALRKSGSRFEADHRAIARPSPIRWGEGTARSHRVQREVAHQLAEVLVGLDDFGVEPSFEEVAAQAIPVVESPRIERVQVTHAGGDGRLGGLHQQVEVVVHQAVAVEIPAVPDDRPPEQLHERPTVDVGQVDELPAVAAHRQVADGVGDLRSQWSGHRPNVRARPATGQS